MKRNVRSSKSFLLSGVVAAVVIGVSVFAPHAADASNSDLGVSTTDAPVAGSVVNLNSAFKNIGAAGNYTLDTEVYSPNNIKVAQFSEPVWMNTNDSVTKAYQWNSAGLATGGYRISQGLFTANWSHLVEWRTNAGALVLTTPKPWAMTATATTGALSSAVNLRSAFTAPIAGSYLLDTEIYDANSNRVAQWSTTQVIASAATATLTYSWVAPGGAVYPADAFFTVRQGVFTSGWSQMLGWSDHSTTFKVASVTTTTAAPTSSESVASQPVMVPSPSATAPAASESPKSDRSNPLSGLSFYGTNAGAAAQAAAWQSTRPADAALMNRLTALPSATWMGEWSGDVTAATTKLVSAASSAGKTAVLVAYNLPQRDCGGYSSGGQTTAAGYNSWISAMAAGLGGHRAVVILEPDALGVQNCLSSSEITDRYAMLANAVHVLHNAGAYVYLDASYWVDAKTMAAQLVRANVAEANGFAVNTSNFNSTASATSWAAAVSAAVGGAHYVVDTSRNGNGGNGQWCNPAGQAVGHVPTGDTGIANADAFLWLKTPGESDGTCNGGPSAGTFWGDYALGLARAAWS